MSRPSISVELDVRQVEKLADSLGRLTERKIGEVTVEALNSVIDETYVLGRERMNRNINLSDQYVKDRMRVEHATPRRPVASIVADGDRNTVLSRYDAQPRLLPTKKPPVSGPRKLPFPSGTKQDGVYVSVTRGNKDFIERGFMLPLRRGKELGGNGLGVFARSRDGSLKHRYGPSVYQLFRAQLDPISYGAEEMLERELLDKVARTVAESVNQ